MTALLLILVIIDVAAVSGINPISDIVREAAKKVCFSCPATKREEGGKGRVTKKKKLFLKYEQKNPKTVATKLEGEGGMGKAIVATKKKFRLPWCNK